MIKHGYAYTEEEWLRACRTGDGTYLIYAGSWYELTEDGKCKLLSEVEAGRHLQTGIFEMPHEITEEDIANAERVGLTD